MGISILFDYSLYRITKIKRNNFINGSIKTNQFEMSPKFIKLKCAYDYFVLCKMFRIIFERIHEHFTQKKYNQLIAHELEARSRVNNKLCLLDS